MDAHHNFLASCSSFEVMVSILFIAYYFPPAGGAGVQRSEKFVRYLPSEGFLPIVITSPGALGDRWTPRDEAFPNESLSKTQIFRAAGPIPQDNGRWNSRLGRWLAYPAQFSKWWVKSATEVALESIDGAKLIFATMSPFSTAKAARQISRRTGIPWIADLRDPWALDEMQIYPSFFHRKLELRRMGRMLSSAAGIIMNTPEAKAALQKAFPFLRKKPVTTITNGYDAADFAGSIPSRTDGKFRIVHTGYLHTELGLDLRRKRSFYRAVGGIETEVDILTRSHVFLLRAIEQWIGRHPEIALELELVFAGVISEQDRSVGENSVISHLIRFTGYLPHAESVRLIRTADLLFLPMHNLGGERRSRIVPGKTYEYMATGRPILAAVPEGDARDFLKRSGVALLTKPDDVGGMVRHLDNAYSAWKKGVSLIMPDYEFISGFDRAALTCELAAFFNQVLEAQEPRHNLIPAS